MNENPKLVSFENTFYQDALQLEDDNPDAFGCITIDGYPEDDDASGAVVAQVFITTKGQLITAWSRNDLRLNKSVLELIADAKRRLMEDWKADNAPRE